MWPNLPEIPLEDQRSVCDTHTSADMTHNFCPSKNIHGLKEYKHTGRNMYTCMVQWLKTHTHTYECIDTENLNHTDYLNNICSHTLSLSETHAAPCGPQPTCNQVRQWLSEIALATLSWVWWETGLVLWWIPALPRFRQGKNERVMLSLTHSSVSRDSSVSVCICECVREGEMKKSRQTGKGEGIIPHLQVAEGVS